jgi:hypothetical protein
MFSANRKRMQSRKAIELVCLTGLLLAAFGSCAVAGDNTTSYIRVAEGSTITHR